MNMPLPSTFVGVTTINARLYPGLLYLTLTLIFGGADQGGVLINVGLQALAPLLLLFVVLPGKPFRLTKRQKAAFFLISSPIVIAALQLIPLPPDLWEAIPGRARIAEGFLQIGEPLPFLPISLAPVETLSTIVRFFPALGVFLYFAALVSRKDFVKSLPALLFAISFASSLVGLFQIFSPHQNPLYFYDVTNNGSGVGFYANANHQASFLLMCLPFAILSARSAFIAEFDSDHFPQAGYFLVALVVFIILGIGAAGSVAGYMMLGPVLIASLFTQHQLVRDGAFFGMPRLSLLALAIVFFGVSSLGYLFAVSPLPYWLGINLAELSADHGRPQLFSNTIEAIAAHFPVGSGMGSFEALYPYFEDPERVKDVIANHAHNDYLEFFLETGLAGIAIVASALWVYVRTSLRTWRSAVSERNALQRAASIAIGVVAVHSLVDYPLRTAATACLCALCVAILTAQKSNARTRKA